MRIPSLTCLCIVLAAIFLAEPAHSQTAAGAETVVAKEEALIRQGIDFRKARDDLAARNVFQKAYDLTRSPRAAAQLGLAEFALGRWEDAEAHVSEALRAPRDPWIAKYRKELDDSLARIKTHVARVEVIGDPPGAEVYVNGRLSGRLPLPTPVPVSEGLVDVEVRSAGFKRGSRTVTVSGGQYQRLVIRLEPEPGAAKSGVDPSRSPGLLSPAGESASGGEGALSPAASDDPVGQSRHGVSTARKAAKWGALGLAGLGLATGVAATVVYVNNTATFESLNGGQCRDRDGQAVDISGNPFPACQASLDAYLSARTWQIVGFAGAGVFAATWLVLALTEPASGPASAARSNDVASWTCLPTLSVSPGAACSWRF